MQSKPEPQNPKALGGEDWIDRLLAIGGLEVYERDDGALLPRLTHKGKAAIQAQVDEVVRKARINELRTISSGRFLRNIHMVVNDANGDVYEDDSRLYISKYEVQERIEQLTTQSDPTPKEQP